MKILWTITYFRPYTSGLALYADRITNILPEYEHTILCNLHKNELPETEIDGNRVLVRAKPLVRISKGFISLDWYRKLFKLVRQTDLVILHLPQAEAGLTAIVAKLARKNIICIYVKIYDLMKALL